MPTRSLPSALIRIPGQLTGVSGSQGIMPGDRVVEPNLPAASTGNTTSDHIRELLARSGHSAATAYATETQYAVGDEVYWEDSSNVLNIYVRLTAGQDPSGSTPNNLPTRWRRVTNSLNDIPVEGDASEPSLLVKGGGHGAVRGEVDAYTRLQASTSAAQVNAAIDAAITALTDLSLWRGAWAANTQYAVGQYVYHPVSGVDQYFRRRVAGRGNTGPAGDTANWAPLTGRERLSAIRLRNVSELLVESLDLDPAQANRGMYPVRSRTDENYVFGNPPMLFRGDWAAGDIHYFGNVVRHGDRLWVLTPLATIVTGKTGAGSEPGTDTDWSEIAVTAVHVANTRDWLGPWEDIDSGTRIIPGQIVSHTDFIYICEAPHDRGNAGPDAQTDNWTLLDNWGGSWVDRYYHEGVLVEHGGGIYVSRENVERGDPQPGADDDTKWSHLGGDQPIAPTTDFSTSETIGQNSDGEAILESPGRVAVWSGPSQVGRGAPVIAGVLGTRRRPVGHVERIILDDLPEDLSDIASINAAGELVFTHTPSAPPRISLDIAWTDPLTQYDPRIAVDWRPTHAGSPTTIIEDDVAIPGSPSPNSPVFQRFRPTQTAQDGFHPEQGDSIVVRIWRGANFGRDIDFLNSIRSIRLNVHLDGPVVATDDLNTAPVEARPARDVISYDDSEAFATLYQGANWEHDNFGSRQYTPFGDLAAADGGSLIGNGWRIVNRSRSRGYAHYQHSSDIVIEAAGGGRFDFKYRAKLVLEDQTSDPLNSDQERFDLMRIRAGVDSDNGDVHGVSIGHAFGYDLSEINNAVPLTFAVSGDHIRTTTGNVPAGFAGILTSGSAVEFDWGNNRQSYLRYDRERVVTKRASLRIAFTRDPGPLFFKPWLLEFRPGYAAPTSFNEGDLPGYVVRDHWTHNSPTAENPSILEIEFYNSSAVSGRLLTAADVFTCLLEPESGHSLSDLDLGAISDARFETVINYRDNDNLDIAIDVTDAALNEDDILYILMTNSTTSNTRRTVQVNQQTIEISNHVNVAGREFGARGGMNSDQSGRFSWQGDGTNADNTWTTLTGDGGEYLTMLQDARKVSLTIGVPQHGMPFLANLELWRQLPGVLTRERVGRLQAHPDVAYTFRADAYAAKAGERFFLLSDRYMTAGGWTARLEAITVNGLPIRQIRTAGMFRNDLVVDGTVPATNNGAWSRIPVIGNYNWKTDPRTVQIYMAAGSDNQYMPITILPEMLATIAPAGSNLDRLGNAPAASDVSIQYTHRLASGGGSDLVVSVMPLTDGGIAVSRGDNAQRRIIGWAE